MPTSAFFCWSSKASAISTGSTSQENEDSWLRTGFPAFSPHTNLHRSDAICCTKVLMLWDLWWLCGIVERSCCHRRRRNISFTLCRDATLVSKEYKVGLFQQWYLESLFFNQTPLSQVKEEHDIVHFLSYRHKYFAFFIHVFDSTSLVMIRCWGSISPILILWQREKKCYFTTKLFMFNILS